MEENSLVSHWHIKTLDYFITQRLIILSHSRQCVRIPREDWLFSGNTSRLGIKVRPTSSIIFAFQPITYVQIHRSTVALTTPQNLEQHNASGRPSFNLSLVPVGGNQFSSYFVALVEMDSTKSALMDITSIDTSTTAHSSPSACPFLHILNLDVRTIIYQYLLVGSYNKRELDMKSREVRELGSFFSCYTNHRSI